MSNPSNQNEKSFEKIQKGAEGVRPLNEDEQSHIKGGNASNPPGANVCIAYVGPKFVKCREAEAMCLAKGPVGSKAFDACMGTFGFNVKG